MEIYRSMWLWWLCVASLETIIHYIKSPYIVNDSQNEIVEVLVMMNGNGNQNNDQYTVVGTNIDEVKRLNAQSGLSYNEVKELLARTTGVKGKTLNSYTNVNESKINNKH